MTTKQPPAQKHLEMAKKISVIFYKEGSWHENELAEKIAAALKQVERDALASKVVGPSDEDARRILMKCLEMPPVTKNGIPIYYNDPIADFLNWYRSQLTLAPSEQVIRVPKIKKSWYDPSYGHGGGSWVDEICEHNDVIKAIKRLNKQARIEESNE